MHESRGHFSLNGYSLQNLSAQPKTRSTLNTNVLINTLYSSILALVRTFVISSAHTPRRHNPCIQNYLILPRVALRPHFRGLDYLRRGTFRRVRINAGGDFSLLCIQPSPSPAEGHGHHLVDLASQLRWTVRLGNRSEQSRCSHIHHHNQRPTTST